MMARKCMINGGTGTLNACLSWPDFLALPLQNGLRGPWSNVIRGMFACSSMFRGSVRVVSDESSLLRIFTKMATGPAVLDVFFCHVRHIEASYLKLASGLGSILANCANSSG